MYTYLHLVLLIYKKRDIGQMHMRQNNINTNILVVMTLNVISNVIDYIYKVIVILIDYI